MKDKKIKPATMNALAETKTYQLFEKVVKIGLIESDSSKLVVVDIRQKNNDDLNKNS